MPTTLTPQDLAFIAKMPGAAQFTGGENALNQAAFSNIPAAIPPYGIVPTPPTVAAPAPAAAAPAAAAPAASRGTRPPAQQGGQGGQQFYDHLKKLLQPPPKKTLADIFGPHGATQGGPGVGSTAANEAISNLTRENVALHPDPKQAIQLAMSATGPFGMMTQMAKMALSTAINDPNSLLGQSLGTAFNVAGPQLSQEAINQVISAFNSALNPTASNIQQAIAKATAVLNTERALAGVGGKGQGPVSLSGSGKTPLGGWGTTPSGELTGNFTSGLGARLIGGSNFGGGNSTGGGGVGTGGGDGSGGMGGGVGGRGQSRSN